MNRCQNHSCKQMSRSHWAMIPPDITVCPFCGDNIETTNLSQTSRCQECDNLRKEVGIVAMKMSEQARQRGFAEGRVEFLEKQLADAEKVLRLITSHCPQPSGGCKSVECEESRGYFERWK